GSGAGRRCRNRRSRTRRGGSPWRPRRRRSTGPGRAVAWWSPPSVGETGRGGEAGALAGRAGDAEGGAGAVGVAGAGGDGDGREAVAGRADSRRGRGVLGHDGGSFRLRLEGTAPGGGVLGGLCATRRPVSERCA